MSILPVSSPPGSTAASASGMGKLRQMLMSDAIPVTPIRPIPDERRRRQGAEQVGKADDAIRGGRQAGEAQDRRPGQVAKEGNGFELPAGLPDEGPVTPTPVPLSADPVTSFVTQSIYQEAMGTGLHIEPWDAAIEAYRKADSVPLPRSAAGRTGTAPA
ncbi:hypothetical protein M2352_004405 [Azospirillum fermentarium]|uniref:hypothetical protein n=1 Tax=Azospirillum fermentarium TaxID=1233114 RepID=UPI002226210F|nr:hypothetical protein [Azospirillum fermentarium]MCW2248745.1 hypothetical protein [Azospirillum fermentarium]